MKNALGSLTLTTILLFVVSAIAAEKVVVIPLGSSASVNSAGEKLWSTGRPGTGLMTHTDPKGYCTTSAGIKYALSVHMAQWGNVADVCPAGTWVCTESELPVGVDTCSIVPVSTYSGIECNGSLFPGTPDQRTALWGFIANATPNNTVFGRMIYTEGLIGSSASICFSYRAWCCWQ